MSDTLIDETIAQENAYGITAEMREKYRQRLEQMIKEQGIKAAQSSADLYCHSEKSAQTPQEIQAEIDEFLQMLEADRKLSSERKR